MKLKQLVRGLDVLIKGSKEVEITGISSHSHLVTPGCLFIAKKGGRFNGVDFISQAFKFGAVAVLTDMYNPFFKHIVQVISSDITFLEILLSKRYYGDPASSLFLVGITGTNGKTTTAYLVRHLLGNCGLLGTIEHIIGTHRLSVQLTTSDVVTNYKMLRKMVDQKMTNAVMEVTSHALEQNRVGGILFDLGVFTNFSQDHLDYHGSIEAYRAAKISLFKQVKRSIINRDERAVDELEGITYGIDNAADFRGGDIEESLDGTRFNLYYQNRVYPFVTQLIGIYNVYNCLAAIAVGICKGHSFSVLQKKLAEFTGVAGRLEKISNVHGFYLFVDFAHTEQALVYVLSTLKRIKMERGKIITIFGCGGERDQGKRPKMARAVEKFSDCIIVTSDNPRYEDPMHICCSIAKGFVGKYQIEVDRKIAIKKGISMAQRGDIVLIAGKGHELFQNIAGRSLPFDDREVAREIVSTIESPLC